MALKHLGFLYKFSIDNARFVLGTKIFFARILRDHQQKFSRCKSYASNNDK